DARQWRAARDKAGRMAFAALAAVACLRAHASVGSRHRSCIHEGGVMKHWTRMPSPIGDLILVEEDGALTGIGFTQGRHPEQPPGDVEERPERCAEELRRLQEYIPGDRRDIAR